MTDVEVLPTSTDVEAQSAVTSVRLRETHTAATAELIEVATTYYYVGPAQIVPEHREVQP